MIQFDRQSQTLRRCLSLCLLAAGVTVPARAQQTAALVAPASPAGVSALPSAPAAVSSVRQPAMQDRPIYSTAVGIIYLQTDLKNVSGGTGSYLLGWYGIPQIYFTKHLSGIGDFANFYNFHAHQSTNVHSFLGGFAYGEKLGGVIVYPFVLGGDIRTSNAGTITWTPAAAGGIGVNLKLSHAVALQVIPGEYITNVLPNGHWQSNYSARAGFVFTSFKRHTPST